MALTYAVNRDEGTVTVYPSVEGPKCVCARGRYEHGTDLDESDLVRLLADLQGAAAYDTDTAGYL